MTVMRDVAIAKTHDKRGERAITKIQDFVRDEILFEYCSLPEVELYSAQIYYLLGLSV